MNLRICDNEKNKVGSLGRDISNIYSSSTNFASSSSGTWNYENLPLTERISHICMTQLHDVAGEEYPVL